MDNSSNPTNATLDGSKPLILPWLLAMGVLLTGIAATAAYWHYHKEQKAAAHKMLFNSEADRIITILDRKLTDAELAMRGVQAFFKGSDEVTVDEFNLYASTVRLSEKLNGIDTIAFSLLVPREQLEAHIRTHNQQMPGEYTVKSTWDGDTLAPIAYMETTEPSNKRALGFDIFSNEKARQAAIEARDKNITVITPPTNLYQDENLQTPSFVMYLPVFNENSKEPVTDKNPGKFIGWVDVPFRMKVLIENMKAEINPDILIDIYDRELGPEKGFLFRDEPLSDENHKPIGGLVATYTLPIGNREWTVSLHGTTAFLEHPAISQDPGIILIAGGSTSLALALLIFMIARSRDQSERKALRLGNLYHALSEVNQAIVRMEKVDHLFALVCRMSVHYGGMKTAWIGEVNNAEGIIRVAGSYGQGTDHLQGLIIPLDTQGETGEGITALANRESRPVIRNRFLHTTESKLAKDKAKKLGWASIGAFPILRGGKPFAILTVTHDKKDIFDTEMVNLLKEMCSDIGFAFDNFDRETERMAAVKSLAESEATLSTVLNNVGASIYMKDCDGRYLFANRQALAFWGLEEQRIIGNTDEKLFDNHTSTLITQTDQLVFEKGQVVEREETAIGSTGERHFFWSVKLPLRRPDGTIYGLCGISTDISEHKSKEEKIQFLTDYDLLTGLPNRELLRQKVAQAISSAATQNERFSILCIDLDRFKNINDSLGLSAGDKVLTEIAERLSKHLNLDITLSRMGGDNFALLLPGAGSNGARSLGRILLKYIAKPLEVNGNRVSLTACIGIATFPEHGAKFDELIQSADAALSSAKASSSDSVVIFEPSMKARVDETLQLENDLRDALKNNELFLLYQPQVEMNTNQIIGVEALVRWRHPKLGIISPIKFIPIAEQTGRIIEIGSWVLDTAAKQLSAWRQAGLAISSVSVNISAAQLYKEEFIPTLRTTLNSYNLPPKSLDLEITESIAMESSSYIVSVLGKLQEIGVGISIDDFGTGYSSLAYLKRYPVNKLKIDKSFVDGLPEDSEDQAIVMAVIGIAQALGLRTVAEGVETKEQWEFLVNSGCSECQGYFYSKPITPDMITDMLKRASFA